jgi:uncharacterized protein YigE (DUF2233 family)
MRLFIIVVLPFLCASGVASGAAADGACETAENGGVDYVVCRFDPAASDIRLFLSNESGEPYGHFNWVNEALAKNGEKLAFAMNAGMYHEDRSPVGLYMEAGEEVAPLNTNDGPGNFHLKPNGVFWIYFEHGSKAAGISASEMLELEAPDAIYHATQSGPMLVVNGEIHPRFLANSDSFKRRNGVGVTEEGEVIFALADTPVRFYDFATFFRDELKTPNALYLDGTISRLYAPALDRNDPGVPMGPIVGVVVKND